MEETGSYKHGLKLPEAEWKIVITKHLGKKFGIKYRNIAQDILAVDTDLKTGFLFDYTSLETEKLRGFIEELGREKLIEHNLDVINVAADNLVMNFGVATRDRADWDTFHFVDVSGAKKCPSIIQSNNDLLLETRVKYEQLRGKEIDRVTVDDNLVNPSTLFGVLIGYPVVYWYAMSDDSDNCLNMTPLNCVQVLNGRHLLFSFSVPVCLWGSLEKVVRAWFDNLLLSAEKTSHFHSLRLNIETVCLPQVCL